jgi:hypothetical protein
MKRRNLLMFLATLAGLMHFGDAFAYCYFSGKIGRTYATQAGSNDYAYFYVYPETSSPYTGNYAWYGRVEGSDEALLGTLNSANAADLTVYCRGDASACPTTSGYRWVSYLDYCYTYEHR